MAEGEGGREGGDGGRGDHILNRHPFFFIFAHFKMMFRAFCELHRREQLDLQRVLAVLYVGREGGREGGRGGEGGREGLSIKFTWASHIF